jgi:hypothetical protein
LLTQDLRELVEQFLAAVPAPPTTRRSLRRFVNYCLDNPDVVNALFSYDFTQLLSPPSCSTFVGRRA